MVGTTKYTHEQIRFILDRTIGHFPRGHLAEAHRKAALEFRAKFGFGEEDFGVNQVRYVTDRYGSDPEYGNRQPNLIRGQERFQNSVLAGLLAPGAESATPLPENSSRDAENPLLAVCHTCGGTGRIIVGNVRNHDQQGTASSASRDSSSVSEPQAGATVQADEVGDASPTPNHGADSHILIPTLNASRYHGPSASDSTAYQQPLHFSLPNRPPLGSLEYNAPSLDPNYKEELRSVPVPFTPDAATHVRALHHSTESRNPSESGMRTRTSTTFTRRSRMIHRVSPYPTSAHPRASLRTTTPMGQHAPIKGPDFSLEAGACTMPDSYTGSHAVTSRFESSAALGQFCNDTTHGHNSQDGYIYDNSSPSEHLTGDQHDALFAGPSASVASEHQSERQHHNEQPPQGSQLVSNLPRLNYAAQYGAELQHDTDGLSNGHAS